MEPLAPQAPDFVEKTSQRTPITRDAVVGVVTL